MVGDWDGQSIVSSDEKLKGETSLEKEKDHTMYFRCDFSQRCLENWRIWSVISKNVESKNLSSLLNFLTHWQFGDTLSSPSSLKSRLQWFASSLN